MLFLKTLIIFFLHPTWLYSSNAKVFLIKKGIIQVKSAQANYEEPDDPLIRKLLTQQE